MIDIHLMISFHNSQTNLNTLRNVVGMEEHLTSFAFIIDLVTPES